MVASPTTPTKNVGTAKGTDPLGKDVTANSTVVTITFVPTPPPPPLPPVEVPEPEVEATAIVPEVKGVVVEAADELPRTGTDPGGLLQVGGFAPLAGLAALLAARLRRRDGDLI
ncbi:MAG: hypothetical protein ACRDZ3_12920 [Acidimicrobiia bacterium]